MNFFSPSSRRRLTAFLLVASGVATVLAPAGQAATEARAEVTGLVTAPSGEPLAGLTVELRLARRTFEWRSLRRGSRDTETVSATTDAAGAFTLGFPQNGFFNQVELVVALPVQTAGALQLEVLERVDLSRRLRKPGSQVVVPVVVRNAEFVASYRQFVASLASDEERRVFAEQGRPDEVKIVNFPDRVEASWWYFRRGQVYRFVAGRLAEVSRFDPIEPLP